MATAPSAGDPYEPDRSFQHAMLKVDWAKLQITNLNMMIERLFNHYRESGSVRFEPDTGNLIAGSPIPPEIALLAGDAIFSLRSALDCCWMGLKRAIDATASKGTLPRGMSREEVKGTLEKSSIEQTFIGVNALILDTVKPYQSGNEVLWFTGQADNWNKHNMLLLALQSISVSMSGVGPGGGTFKIEGDQFLGCENLRAISLGPGVELDREPAVAFAIILKSRTPADERPLEPFLLAALKGTHEAVQSFASQFGKNQLKEPEPSSE